MSDFADEIKAAINKARQIFVELKKTPNQTLGGALAQGAQFLGVTPVYENFAPNLLEYTERTCNLTIKLSVVPVSGTGTFGATVAVYENDGKRRAEINVVAHNHCNLRFFACKELMHIHLMTEQNRTATREQFDRMLGELTSRSNLDQSTVSDQTIVDWAAYYGALELVMPTTRLKFVQEVLGITESAGIAEFFRIPKWIVEQALQPSIRIHFD